MQIAYHIGAQCTDEGRLLRSLMKNREMLEDYGIALPNSRSYRQILPRVAVSLRGSYAEADTQQVILDAVMETEDVERLVFSHENLLCFPTQTISNQGFYANAPKRLAAYTNLFPHFDTEFFLALRNPATHVPAIMSRLTDASYETVMNGYSPLSLRWAPLVREIVETTPGINLTIWCNEDTPLIWPELLRLVAGLGPEAALDGDFDMLSTIMSDEGLLKLKAYFEAHPPSTVSQRRRATTAFLERYANEDEIEMEVSVPGWSADLIDAMTDAYDADCEEIANMPGVVFVAP